MTQSLARRDLSDAEPPRVKVGIAARWLRRANEWSDVATIAADVATLTPGAFSGIDAAICSYDNARARYLSARLLLAARVPWIDAGVLADRFVARVQVCDPARVSGAAPDAEPSCIACPWGATQLARSGEDLSLACAGVQMGSGDGAPSTLPMGQRAASLAVHELLALLGVVRGLAPHPGFEIRDDLGRMRLERFRVRPSDACAADHALCAPSELIGLEPEELLLGELARACDVRPEDAIVLATTELVHTAACLRCWSTSFPFRRLGGPRLPCGGCGAPMVPVRRTRRVRWGEAAASVRHASASEWLSPGDKFAVISRGGVRTYRFPAKPLDWRAGAPWHEATARPRYERLPGAFDLDAIRTKRIALLGAGNLGSAALQQLAPLPFAGFLVVDRDVFEERNRASFALPVEEMDP